MEDLFWTVLLWVTVAVFLLGPYALTFIIFERVLDREMPGWLVAVTVILGPVISVGVYRALS